MWVVIKRIVFLVFLFLTIANSSFAQRTLVYTGNDAVFKSALDLYNKQKYASAQKQFYDYLKLKNTNTQLVADADYYVAICAAELFNGDAEDLLKGFIIKHAESPRLKAAYFSLATYLYRKKKYKESIEWFEKTDKDALSKEQLTEYYFKSGYAYFDGGDYEKAKPNLYEVKDADSKYAAPALYYYSHIAYLQKNYETALQGFLKLNQNESFAHIVPYYVVQLYYLESKYDSVISYAPPLLDSANTKRAPEIARLLGESYYRTNKFEKAVKYLELHLEKVGVVNREDHYQLGYAYYKIKNYTEAIDHLSKVPGKADSLSQIAYYTLGDCYLATSKKTFARSTFYSAAKYDFDKELQEDALYNFAKLAYELDYNPYDEAVKAFEMYLNKYPNSKNRNEAYNYLVNVYLTTKNYKYALESIDKIDIKTEDLKYAYQRVAFNRAVELFNNQDYVGAEDMFTKSLEYKNDKPLAAQSYFWMGELFYRKDDYKNAIDNYKKFLFEPGAAITPYFNQVNYTLGYSYYVQKQYADAILWFRKFVGNSKELDTRRKNDSFLRIADAYFISKDYLNAVDFYEESVKLKEFDVDYALLQRSMAAGLLGKDDIKESGLKELLSSYPRSSYRADAYYELGNLMLQKNNAAEAVVYFDNLNREHPQSSYVKASLLKKGLVYKNANQDAQAIETFKRVVNDYPATTEAKDALNQIKYLFIEDGKVEDWETYAKTVSFADISVTELDSASYDLSVRKYSAGDCENSINDFNNYLKKYPDGIFFINANYYKAECEYKLNRPEEALKSYEQIIAKPKTKYTESALLKAAYITYNKVKDYNSAAKYYQQLEQQAEFKENIMDAKVGLMRCFFKQSDFEKAKDYSNKVLLSEKISNDLTYEAKFILAQSLLNLKDTTLAMAELIALGNTTNAEIGANAKYMAAEIYFNKGDIANAEKLCFEIINQDPSYDYWIAKCFILLGDIYKVKGDNFQAKQTLQSIIDNFDGADLIKIAQDKLDKIIQSEKEAEQQKLKEQMQQNQIQNEAPADEKIFEEENPQEGGNNNE